MTSSSFKGILIDKDDAGYHVGLRDLEQHDLPAGDVSVQVSHSTLNYKDALAITGSSPIIKRFPMVPGVDLAGTVEASDNPRFKAGDKVVLNGWGVGESHWGGLAQRARLQGQWLIPCRRLSRLRRPWPSARQATPPCSASLPWKSTVSNLRMAKYW